MLSSFSVLKASTLTPFVQCLSAISQYVQPGFHWKRWRSVQGHGALPAWQHACGMPRWCGLLPVFFGRKPSWLIARDVPPRHHKARRAAFARYHRLWSHLCVCDWEEGGPCCSSIETSDAKSSWGGGGYRRGGHEWRGVIFDWRSLYVSSQARLEALALQTKLKTDALLSRTM